MSLPQLAPSDTSLWNSPWHAVCLLEDITPNTGVCALIEGIQIAIVRVDSGADVGAEVYAIANFDPFSKAFVLGRGIVGDKGGIPKITSPIYKQSFNLRTGQCLEDASVTVPTWPVRVRAGRVEVRMERSVPLND